MDKLIKEIGMKDVPLVGGKNASLGEMFNDLITQGIRILDGFATTAEAFRCYLKENELDEKRKNLLKALDRKEYSNLDKTGAQARKLILGGNFSEDLERAIRQAYRDLSGEKYIEVAVRSSVTAEDLPQAS